MSENETYERAKKRVEAKIGFYRHAGTYLVVSIVLYFINKITSPGYNWFIWPMLGWGVAVVFHGLDVFALSEESAWKDRMIRKEMEKIKNTRGD